MKQIVIYVDKGVDGNALRQTVKSLQQELDKNMYSLKRMDAAALKEEDWQKNTALLVVPGGRDIYYEDALSGKGTEKIYEYVSKGGAYLGICAGAYFASGAIEFEKGGPLQVCANRCLKFYPGLAVGPAYGPNRYSYQDERGVEAALISCKSEEYCTYYNGGCFFEGPEKYSSVDVLANYADIEGNPAAIISCRVNKGKAVLSGVHLEFNPQYLSRESPYINRIYPLLERGDEKRRALFRSILDTLLKSE